MGNSFMSTRPSMCSSKTGNNAKYFFTTASSLPWISVIFFHTLLAHILGSLKKCPLGGTLVGKHMVRHVSKFWEASPPPLRERNLSFSPNLFILVWPQKRDRFYLWSEISITKQKSLLYVNFLFDFPSLLKFKLFQAQLDKESNIFEGCTKTSCNMYCSKAAWNIEFTNVANCACALHISHVQAPKHITAIYILQQSCIEHRIYEHVAICLFSLSEWSSPIPEEKISVLSRWRIVWSFSHCTLSFLAIRCLSSLYIMNPHSQFTSNSNKKTKQAKAVKKTLFPTH